MRPVSPLGRLRDGLVLVGFALYATPFLWQFLTAFKPEAELMVLPPSCPRASPGSTSGPCSTRA